MDDLLMRISFDKDVLCGKPVIRGLRISVEMILELLAKGATPAEILEDYPVLELEDVQAALLYAHHLVAGEAVLGCTYRERRNLPMTKLEELEQEIKQLSREDLRSLRRWFLEQEAEEWDGQIEEDVQTGKLDKLAEDALRDHAAGKSRVL